jgi:ABC-type antimicrobial peptide transport system permease subunit
MTVRTALAALARNLTRSGLTVLGVVIGVAALIAMVSVGQGADAAVRAQLRSLGTNVVMVYPGTTTTGGVRTGSGNASTLTVADARAVEKECASVGAVTWLKREVAQVTYGNQNWSTAIQGSPPSFSAVRNWPVARGRFFTSSEEDGAAKVAVVGQTIVDMLFAPGEDPLGATIRVKNVPFRVIGVLARKGRTSWGQDQDDVVIVPFNTAERRVLGASILGTVNMLLVSAATPALTESTVDEITRLLRARHRIPEGEDDDFTVRNMTEMFEASLAASRVMSNLLAAIASISLLVGGIGIMNILLVSVAERTREIGIRLAVGAKARHILLQFLVESIVLSVAGGILGALLGVGAAALIGRVAGWPILVSPGAVALALVFAAGLGVLFGAYPARRAAGLDPIVALRHE